jgi:CDP-diacylglycerol--glycerol-3-phosphate 3-phosphatidyltransferase
MLTEPLRRLLQGQLDRIAALFHRLGISPNALTFGGAALHLVVLYLLAKGSFLSGAALLLVASGLDGIDGTLARNTGQSSRIGAFLDSTLDRVSEILVYLGLLIYAGTMLAQGETPFAPIWLIYLAVTGSVMVSYSRARSEGIGLPTHSGWFTRFERMVLLLLGLISGWVTPALWIVMLGAWFTTIQRVADVWRLASVEDGPHMPQRREPGQDGAELAQGAAASSSESLERGSEA